MSAVHKDLTNPEYVAWTEFLRAADSWSEEEIREHELNEIRRVASFAQSNTSGYRGLFKSVGVDPSQIGSLDDFRHFPFLTKEMIRDGLEAFSADVPGRFIVTTGGSTGVPTGMYRDPISFAKELASKAHQYYRVGWREGDRQIVFRGLQIDSADNMEFAEQFNELRCSTYQFVPEQVEIFRQKAFEFAPEWIRCYPSSGYVFAKYLKDLKLSFPKIKGLLLSSEQLYDFQRRLFEEVYGSEVRLFSHYGHYEMAALAGFCEKTDYYHVLPQYGFVELLDKDNKQITVPGEVGEIVATSFIMNATPFIRYRTGDLAVFKSFGCKECGRPYQVWEKVQGRLQELIVTKSGRLISTSMLNMHDESYDHLKQFQFHQSVRDSVTFRFIAKRRLADDQIAGIRQNLQNKLGSDIELIMEPVDDIPLTSRGKHRLLIQELDLQFDHPSLGKTISV